MTLPVWLRDIGDKGGDLMTTITRTSGKEVTRTKGYGVRDRVG